MELTEILAVSIKNEPYDCPKCGKPLESIACWCSDHEDFDYPETCNEAKFRNGKYLAPHLRDFARLECEFCHHCLNLKKFAPLFIGRRIGDRCKYDQKRKIIVFIWRKIMAAEVLAAAIKNEIPNCPFCGMELKELICVTTARMFRNPGQKLATVCALWAPKIGRYPCRPEIKSIRCPYCNSELPNYFRKLIWWWSPQAVQQALLDSVVLVKKDACFGGKSW